MAQNLDIAGQLSLHDWAINTPLLFFVRPDNVLCIQSLATIEMLITSASFTTVIPQANDH